MKTSMFKRVVSIVLAAVMVFLMLPVVEIETNAAVEFVIPIDDYSDLSFIGRGFNLLGDQYLQFDTLNEYSIFDQNVDAVSLDKIYADGLQSARQEGSFTYITDMSKYMRETQHSVGVGLEMEAKFKMVTLGFKTKYGITGSNKTEGSSKTEYAILNFQSIREVRSVRLDSRTYIERLYEYNMLNEDFVRELTEMTPEDLFKTYGTHIITGYASGGEMYITYEGQNMSSTVTDASSWKSETSISAGVKALGKISANIEAEQKQSGVDGSENSIVTMHTYVTGGSKTGVSPSDILTQKVSPDAWLDSVSDVQDILVNDNLQMIPIWELIIDDQHAEKKAELENYFNQHISAEYAELYGQYVYVPAADEGRFENYTFITSVEQLNAMRDDLNGHYVLCCDLDLQGAEWTPIGTSEAPFNGTFDGNGCTISGLSVTRCTDGAAGLFGYVGIKGSISNLRVAGVVDVDGTGNANNLAYVGGIAGYNEGNITNCVNMVTVNGKITVNEANDQAPAEEEHLVWDYDAILAKVEKTYDLSTFTEDTVINNLDNMTVIKLTGKASKAVRLDINKSGGIPLYIILDNASFNCNNANGAIFNGQNRPVWIIVQGNCAIGNNGTGSAIKAELSNVTIVGEGNLTLTGGKGANGTSYTSGGTNGGTGGNGGVGIKAQSLDVDINGTVTITGGAGGDGGNGGTGTAGAPAKGNSSKRETGGTGGQGGAGGNGGKGATAVDASSLKVYHGDMLLQSGNGGNGGDGGKGGAGGEGIASGGYGHYRPNGGEGGKGGAGGNATGYAITYIPTIQCYLSAKVTILTQSYYGDGGDGGDGGNGGKGGDGTSKEYANANHTLDASGSVGINGGRGGDAGQAGDGGDGAKAGDPGTPGTVGAEGKKGYWHGWFALNGGSAGKPGDPGEDGEKGKVDIGSTGDDPKATITTSSKEYAIYNQSTTWDDANVYEGLIDNAIFKTGNIGTQIQTYTNTDREVTVTLEKGSNPVSSSYPYIMKITSQQGADKRHYGGYRHKVTGTCGESYIIQVWAKIPVGFQIGFYNNWPIGDGGKCEALSDSAGTGDWKLYTAKWTYGNSGKCRDIGYIAVSRTDETKIVEEETVDWYVAYSNMFRILYNTAGKELPQMVSIGSAEEQKLMEELVAIGGQSEYWIGLHWDGEKSRWVWNDGNEMYIPNGPDCENSNGKYELGNCYDEFDEVVFSNWASNEPSYTYEENGKKYIEDAVVIKAGGKWNDVRSDTSRPGYITETDIGTRPVVNLTENTVVAGGIVGFNAKEGIITYCVNEANITIDKAYSANGTITAAAGGIAGCDVGVAGSEKITLGDCYNKGTIKAVAKSDSLNSWARAYAYEICYQGAHSNVKGHVFSHNKCFVTAKSANDLDTTGVSGEDTETTLTGELKEKVNAWDNAKMGITFGTEADYTDKLEYVVGDSFDEEFFAVTLNGQKTEKYVVRYYFLTSGAKLVKITGDDGKYVRTIPVRVAEPTPVELVIDADCNYQTAFVEGDVFNTDGLIMRLVYNNGKTEVLTENTKDVTITAPDMTSAGEKKVIVTYQGQTLEYPITVQAPGVVDIRITKLPDKLIYEQDETIDLTGLVVERVMNNGQVEPVSLAELTVDADFTKPGTAVVTVTHAGYSATFECTVKEVDLAVAPKIVVKSGIAKTGEMVTVDVMLDNNPGVAYLLLTLKYDKSAMTLMSVENGELLKDFDEGVNLQWSAKKNVTENGLLCRLTFEVSADAAKGEYTIDLILRETYNDTDEHVKFYVESGCITVRDFVYGDVNGDGVVNGKDVLLLRKYMVAYDYDNNTSKVEVCAGADANGDGVVNGKDVLLLRKYMAAYDYDTGTSTVVLGPKKDREIYQ